MMICAIISFPFNGVTVKIKEGLPGLGSKLNSKGYRRCANTAHPAISATRASVFTPGEPGAGNRGALPVTEQPPRHSARAAEGPCKGK